jgi:hypothetical protein
MSIARPISWNTGSADLISRQVFDISPGQVCSLRDDPFYQKNARFFTGVIMSALCGKDCLACRQPIGGDFIVWIGKARPGLTRHRRFSGVSVCIPSRIDDRTEFAIQRSENGVDEAAAIAVFEFFPG